MTTPTRGSKTLFVVAGIGCLVLVAGIMWVSRLKSSTQNENTEATRKDEPTAELESETATEIPLSVDSAEASIAIGDSDAEAAVEPEVQTSDSRESIDLSSPVVVSFRMVAESSHSIVRAVLHLPDGAPTTSPAGDGATLEFLDLEVVDSLWLSEEAQQALETMPRPLQFAVRSEDIGQYPLETPVVLTLGAVSTPNGLVPTSVLGPVGVFTESEDGLLSSVGRGDILGELSELIAHASAGEARRTESNQDLDRMSSDDPLPVATLSGIFVSEVRTENSQWLVVHNDTADALPVTICTIGQGDSPRSGCAPSLLQTVPASSSHSFLMDTWTNVDQEAHSCSVDTCAVALLSPNGYPLETIESVPSTITEWFVVEAWPTRIVALVACSEIDPSLEGSERCIQPSVLATSAVSPDLEAVLPRMSYAQPVFAVDVANREQFQALG